MSYDLKLVNGDLSLQNGDLAIVQDGLKLLQDILKICLTQVGANPLQPGYGSFLSRSVIGNPIYSGAIVQIAKAQLNTCLTNLQSLQKTQIKSRQIVSADEQLAAITDIVVIRNPADPRLFNITIKALTAGYKPIDTSFTLQTI